ncbi:DNA topoisomerase ii [Leptomonas pyrrhocoris]|uniref:DNA topoisomerase 2 n=1 Tax=Leptomonas pyrrhocoris TaxID=157538 RepID=A0A0N0DZD8_LEPPY|nr:DNA topoisomerase ii [Leptomonas pyrrhocoris]KPA85188.1 DNA topoisomerase ii [Leptomonas pyrrhocoris]|eukprot:XP_015663627.1 DNA topoisomerase ii [Leptomonas pyrrhocoris]
MGRTVEQIYQKKTQHEHILTRPDMYIGTIEPVTDDMWVYDNAENIMKQRKCTWIPGLYKIFDEILVNAADNKVRDPLGQTIIRVWMTDEYVRVYNNGEGIPIQKHRDHDLWVPEMIFGHLLTSSNYNDAEAKVTGGRNGFGAKLTNVFSKQFEVETVHGRSRKKFYMKWTNNMLQHDDAVIVPCDSADYTMVTFYPDFDRFHVAKFTEDMLLMMKRRVYDVAGCTDKTLKCFLNDERIACTTFPEYVDLYPTMGEEKKASSYARVNDRWELCVRISNMGFQQVSFVNSIATTRGGTHVKYIMDQIVTKVTEQAKKKRKTDVKPHMIRPHIFLFLNCLIENPGFDSQTKETLNTTKIKFGSTCDLPNSLIDYIVNSGIVERSVEMANSKLTKEMASKMRSSDRKQIMGIPKLDDANEAGGKYSHRCTLILTEGDSAKTLCTAGLAVKDRDYFGVFPLRGKPLNVREASLKKLAQCEEIQSVMKIMGLDLRQKYENVDGLRYGHLMIMSDQDHDGSHIKGLLINFIHCYWPNLLRIPGFLQQFITPIVKARPKGHGGAAKAISFFSMPDYFEWKQAIGDNISNYQLRYYKGLGTSGAEEGREYFENIDRHRLDFYEQSPQEEDRIVMAFGKDRVEDRKDWITNFKTNVNVNESMDYNVRQVSYKDFVDKELILFSIADCERSIPSAIDGFKPGQRKILFSCFKRNLVNSIKVVQLAGYVSEHSAYHHGEQSLVQTIVAMAQDFVGSNNVPLLRKDGQFGTRLQGGKDHAAGRYIFTRLMQVARAIFHPADGYIVEYKDDDGLSVEPYFYVPVIPMALVNGTAGIGTGFSTNIPSYNPFEVIDNLERLMRGEDTKKMQPWYFGFTGAMEEKEPGKFVSHGKYEIRPDGVVCITELPIGVWTQNYKKFLEDLREKEMVVQYREYTTDLTVDFEVFLHPQVLQQWVAQDVVEERLQLKEFVHATNIIAFNREGQITKYLDAESLLKDFYLVRLEFYAKRKDYLLGELRRLTSKLENMVRFVREVIEGTLIVTKRKKKELLDDLQRRQYLPFPPYSKKKVSAMTVEEDEEEQRTSAQANDEENLLGLTADPAAMEDTEARETPELRRATRAYDYLLGMKLWNLTAEMIARLEAQLQRARHDTALMEARTPKDIWTEDLKVLREKLESYFADREKEIATVQRKKMEKKKPFDSRRLRVPILSDKARSQLQKDAEKAAKATGRRAGGDDASVGGASSAGGAGTRPPPKKAARRRRRKKDSDEDSEFDEDDWMDDDDDDDDDEGGNIVGMGDAGAPPVVVAAAASQRKPRSASPKAKTAAKKRTRRKKSESDSDDDSDDDSDGGGSSSSPKPALRKPKREKPTAKEATHVRDDFDLDGFGLDALTAPSSTARTAAAKAKSAMTATTATSSQPSGSTSTAASMNGHSMLAPRSTALDDDDDDLLLLGLTKAKTETPSGTTATTNGKAAASSAAKPRAKAASQRKRRGGDSSEESDSSDSSSSDSSSASSSESDSDYSFSD